jgi:Tfp pilus assembly protein PilN
VTRLNAEAAAAETQAGNLSGYEQTVKVAKSRRDSVVNLIEKRFDWSKALNDVSRTLPENVWMTTMAATVAPGVAVEGGTGNPQRSTFNGPAIELTGCTTSQSEVARLMTRLRAMKGVSRVGLATSEKNDASSGGVSDSAASGAANTDCSQSSRNRPKFNLVIFYGTGTASGASGAPSGNAAAAAATNEPASGGAQ